MQEIHDVIVIGCGISGIGASNILSQHKIDHIVLQARARIGGRIFSQPLDGIMMDMGAMVVHHPHEDNAIKKLMDRIGWKYYNKRYDSKQIMVEGGKEIDEAVKKRGQYVYINVLEELGRKVKQSQKNISITQAISDVLALLSQSESSEVIHFAKLLLRIHGNIQGAQLHQLSADQLYIDDQSDVIPQHGYYKLIETICNFHTRPIYFNTKVTSVNYQSDIIEVITTTQTYHCKRLISSLPLGILKSNKVVFNPQLPSSIQQSIDNLGISVFNKVQLSFEQPFWDTSKQYILLVSDKEHFYRMRAFYDDGKYILCAYVSGDASKYLSSLTDQQIVKQFEACLKRYYGNVKIESKSHLITRWHLDENSLGSYTYFPANNCTIDDVYNIRKPINDRIWFVGEHCSPDMIATANGAYLTGIRAAKEIIKIIKNKQPQKQQ